ncbi:MAG TPA: MBL fold metallo-hydrolase [Candidatus Paceibacterota bacterium]|nr:MBL fold metallo-hydrolase [Candidatus Paceibacterota bacterium]
MKKHKPAPAAPIIIAFVLASLDAAVWYQIAAFRGTPPVRDYFLDVGQGDSELIIFPDNVKVMTDAGPTDQVVADLGSVLPPGDAYIDLAVITHPQADHFNGYNFLLDHYQVGAFIYNGRDDDPGVKAWTALKEKIAARGIPFITLRAGDSIRYRDDEIDILSPDAGFAASAELNDTGLVELVRTPQFSTLLTADTGFNVEDWLVAQGGSIHADVLKVGHHGSKYASGDAFLRAVDPEVAVIEVGAKNTYGHPGSSTLARIASDTGARLFRTDQDGTVEVYEADGRLRVVKGK